MQISEVTQLTEWEDFVTSQEFTPFVQSSKYINFYKGLGENGFVVGIYDQSQSLIGGSVVVTTHAKRGNFLYLPYGPILPVERRQEALSALMAFLKEYAQKQGFNFIRVSPFLDETSENIHLFQITGFRSAPMHVLAENTWILNIQESEETLLKNMNKNHRNLIRRCEKEGVVIKKTTQITDLDGLDSLLNITAKRHGFKRFSRKYIENEFQSYLPGNVMLFEAYLPDGTLDGAAVIMFYGNMAAYRHSASLNRNNKIPTSYLLQWEVIKEAKKRGVKWYNFWGIAPDDAPANHPFVGITHFKKGFGGFKKDLVHCQDFSVNGIYWLNWLVETFRRVNRGF